MTQNQKKTIENEFFNYPTSDNALWKAVFENTLKKFKWEREELVMKKRFIEKKQRYNICRELQIPKRTYYLYLNRIYETAFMWAVELKVI